MDAQSHWLKRDHIILCAAAALYGDNDGEEAALLYSYLESLYTEHWVMGHCKWFF